MSLKYKPETALKKLASFELEVDDLLKKSYVDGSEENMSWKKRFNFM
jgi:hypothetical protein